jgi:NAD+ kinase
MDLNRAIISYKVGSKLSKSWAEKCAQQLEQLGCRVMMGPSGPKDNPYPVFLASSTEKIDLAVVLGGDGTILGGARHLAPENIPMLAVNVGGNLGFLTEPFELFKDTESIWQRLLDDRYAVQTRMMLEAYIVDDNSAGIDTQPQPQTERYLCLNEMCVKPASIDRMPVVFLDMEVDGYRVDEYHGDGLIIATPTGSTCYTTSANGPIIHPEMEAIAVTPICPLSLSSRPIVLPPGSVVDVWPLGDYELNTKLWTDSVLATSIWPGQKVRIKMAQCKAKFIILRQKYSFYQTLREKLQWTGARLHFDNNHREHN